VINGVRYDRELLETADGLTTGRGDGRISIDDGRQLWDEAQDGKGVTETEYRTLQYIVDNYNCTDVAKGFLKSCINSDQAVEPVGPPVELPVPEHTAPTVRYTPSRPYEGYLKTHDYLGRKRSPPAPPPKADKPKPIKSTNYFVTSLAFVVCFSCQLVTTYAWYRHVLDTRNFLIATLLNGVLTSFAVQGGVWASMARQLSSNVPSVAQFCGIASMWSGLVAAAMTMAPQHIVAFEFPNTKMETDAAVYLVGECGRLWCLIAMMMAVGALRGSPPKVLAGYLLVYLARPMAALTQVHTGFDCTANWILIPGKAAVTQVDGCCVSLLSVLLLLLLFGIYSFNAGDPSNFVAAGSIAFGLYAVCLLFSPDRYRMEAWPSIHAPDPVMEHYIVALALTMGCVSVLLYYCAKDEHQSARNEIYEATGFVSGMALLVLVWYFQWLLGSMATSANSLFYQCTACVGTVNIALLILGLLCIANAARPHAKSYMRRRDAQKLLLRVLWVCCYTLAIGFFKKTDALVNLLGLNPVNEQLATWLAIGYLTIGCLYSAAAQLSEAVQQRVLQFSMILPFCVLVGGQFFNVDVVQGLFKSPMHVVGFQYLCGVLLMLLVFSCYYTRPTRASKLPEPQPSDDTCTLVLRFLYIQSLYFALQFYLSGPPEWVEGPNSPLWVTHAVLDLSIGLVFMAGDSVEFPAQKKLIKYGMVGTFASLAASYKMYNFEPAVLAIPVVNIAASLHACYNR
jgi:hypothetical protein